MVEQRNSIFQVTIGSVIKITMPSKPADSQISALKSAGFRYEFKAWSKQVKTRDEAKAAAATLYQIFPDAAVLVCHLGRVEGQAFVEKTAWPGRVAGFTDNLFGRAFTAGKPAAQFILADSVSELYDFVKDSSA